MRYTKNSSGYNYKQKIVGGCEKEATALKTRILNAKNTEEIYEISGNKYYISKDMSLKDIPDNLMPGDAVLFERGGLWRILWHEGLIVPKGVTFGSYGEGEKPKFYGSQKNFADNSLWEKVGDNLYKTFLHGGNAGNMVFNDEACLGVKKWNLEDVKANYDFYYAPNEDLYFYYEGNIGEDFESVEVGQRENLITYNSDCVIDNLCVKYTGSHAVAAEHDTENTVVTNCEIGFIGGAMQFGTTRFGNGIELPCGAKNAVVKNNYVYQCYDAGITFQTWTSAAVDTHYYDIDFCENLIENCCYGIEFFTTDKNDCGWYSDYKNINMCRNIIRFSGYDWGQLQRPDPWMNSHIRGGQWAYVEDCENFNITDNMFDISKASIVFWWWHDEEKKYLHPEKHNGLTVKDNIFFGAPMPDKRCMTFHINKPVYADSNESFKKAVMLFDNAPKKTVWFEELRVK